LELLVLLDCKYGYKQVNKNTYVRHIYNLNLTTGVHNLNLTAGAQQKLTNGTHTESYNWCKTRKPYN